MNRSYYTVKFESKAEITKKHSRFIAVLFPLNFKTDIKKYLDSVKKSIRDADITVIVLVFLAQKMNDDGEPKGTAARPILNNIENNNLENILIIVCRYFGGILLGKSGLIESYSLASKIAIENSKIIKMEISTLICFETDYVTFGKIENLIYKEKFLLNKVIYENKVNVSFYVPNDSIKTLENNLSVIEHSIKINKTTEKYNYFG